MPEKRGLQDRSNLKKSAWEKYYIISLSVGWQIQKQTAPIPSIIQIMDSSAIHPDFVEACIRKFTSLLGNRRRLERQSKGSCDEVGQCIYDEAKEHETKTRNLKKALGLYTRAALNGEKTNSCIKDFASVLHQAGFTGRALDFLQAMSPIYKGDRTKYQKLMRNLSLQLRPTGKHDYKNILIDRVDARLQEPEAQILKMFSNTQRIKQISIYEDLGFTCWNKRGRYVLLRFDSFSAAKKTLQTFNEEQLYSFNMYWLDSDFNLVAEAVNGKGDFDRGVVMNKGNVQKIEGKNFNLENFEILRSLPNFHRIYGFEGLELENQMSVHLIQNYQMYFKMIESAPENT